MFNLEQAIADWRRQLLAAGIKSPAPLEELESHLRDEIAHQMKAGTSVQTAFKTSVARIGEAVTLKQEFKKILTTGKNWFRTIGMFIALLGTVVGGAMILPGLGQWRDRGVLHLGPVLVGSALAIMAGCPVIYGVRIYRWNQSRNLISVFVIAAGSFYLVPLIQAFFIPKIDLIEWIFCAGLAAGSILFYGGCLHRIWRPPRSPIGEGR